MKYEIINADMSAHITKVVGLRMGVDVFYLQLRTVEDDLTCSWVPREGGGVTLMLRSAQVPCPELVPFWDLDLVTHVRLTPESSEEQAMSEVIGMNSPIGPEFVFFRRAAVAAAPPL